MKNRKLLRTLEKEIMLYASVNANRTARGFINRVLAYLRTNRELLEQNDYKKLYDECVLVLKWLYRKEIKYKNAQEIFEIVIDLMVKNEGFGYEKDIVEAYLKFRKDAWSSGYCDKLFK